MGMAAGASDHYMARGRKTPPNTSARALVKAGAARASRRWSSRSVKRSRWSDASMKSSRALRHVRASRERRATLLRMTGRSDARSPKSTPKHGEPKLRDKVRRAEAAVGEAHRAMTLRLDERDRAALDL